MKFLYSGILIVSSIFNVAESLNVAFTGSVSSGFAGSCLIVGNAASSNYRPSQLQMKGGGGKGKDMRGQYKRNEELGRRREEMLSATTFGADGLPVFNLYVRTPVANMWYPCGSFKGDDKSKALCKNYVDDGLLSGISKSQLDKGVAGSLFRDKKKLTDQIANQYPQLRKNKDKLQFGYKLSYEGLSKEQLEINVVEAEEQKAFVENVKDFFNVFGDKS